MSDQRFTCCTVMEQCYNAEILKTNSSAAEV